MVLMLASDNGEISILVNDHKIIYIFTKYLSSKKLFWVVIYLIYYMRSCSWAFLTTWGLCNAGDTCFYLLQQIKRRACIALTVCDSFLSLFWRALEFYSLIYVGSKDKICIFLIIVV